VATHSGVGRADNHFCVVSKIANGRKGSCRSLLPFIGKLPDLLLALIVAAADGPRSVTLISLNND
jgi:hypothetical protein